MLYYQWCYLGGQHALNGNLQSASTGIYTSYLLANLPYILAEVGNFGARLGCVNALALEQSARGALDGRAAL